MIAVYRLGQVSWLSQKNIFVRYMNYVGFGDGLRMTVDTTQEVEVLLKELRAVLSD